MSSSTFPPVQGGGSLILAWQIRNKPVLVIGGGEVNTLHPHISITTLIIPQVAAGRILNCLNADALITLVSPSTGLNPEVTHRIHTLPTKITYHDRLFRPSDLDTSPPPSLVLCAIDDPIASSVVYKECQARRIPANIADVPPECDFYFGSVHRQGPLQIMVSTNGQGPRMAALIRRWIGSNLPRNVGDAVSKVGILRKKLRELVPDISEGAKRMGWMSRVCEGWTLEELCEMQEADMDALLEGYESGQVRTFREIREIRGVTVDEEPEEFYGSFGWWI
jgi:precorrin-2 dehydrogenase/sirohydrochlorin ferrochelatase